MVKILNRLENRFSLLITMRTSSIEIKSPFKGVPKEKTIIIFERIYYSRIFLIRVFPNLIKQKVNILMVTKIQQKFNIDQKTIVKQFSKRISAA